MTNTHINYKLVKSKLYSFVNYKWNIDFIELEYDVFHPAVFMNK